VRYVGGAYIAKCYLNEPGADRVRAVARITDGLASCEVGRLEFFSIVKRHQRDWHITALEARDVLADFAADETEGVWHWFPITSGLVTRVCERLRSLPPAAVIRAGDASISDARASRASTRSIRTIGTCLRERPSSACPAST
jgi:hypothetical protein